MLTLLKANFAEAQPEIKLDHSSENSRFNSQNDRELLIGINTTLTYMERDLRELKEETRSSYKNMDDRVRELENWKWKTAGVALGAGGVGSILFKLIFKI